MKNTTQIIIKVNNNNLKDELIAKLSTINYDAFEEKENELEAYIEEEVFDAESLENILFDYNLNYSKSVIKDQNWNSLWESNFPPVIVDDFCVVRAGFHKPFTDKKYEIIITPKMSFGTGHHATTYMMISEMRHIDFKEKQVADFGTGTGVLAILAEKLGSRFVVAIDNDDWSIENSKENIEKNECKNIVVEKAEGFIPKQRFDIVLANINRNIILQNANNLLAGLENDGTLLLSGLLKSDEATITSAFMQRGFYYVSTIEKNKWICLLLNKGQNTG